MTAPPRLIVRTLGVTFVTVAIILTIVFVVLTVDARDRARTAEIEKLQVSAAVFSGQESQRQRDRVAMISTLAENPTLKAGLDTYFSELSFAGITPDDDRRLRDETVTREAEKLGSATGADVVALVDTNRRVFAAAGPAAAAWPVNAQLQIAGLGGDTFEDVVVAPNGGAFRVSGATLRLPGDREVGTLLVATSLDANYANQLSDLARAGVAIIVNDAVVARTVPEDVTRALLAAGGNPAPTQTLNGEEYAVRTLVSSGPARVYMLASIDAAARAATTDAMFALATVAFGGFVLAALGSLWLARTLTDPINKLAGEIETMTAAHDFRRTLEPTGTSRELDALAGAFNDLMRGLMSAEAETRAAYVGAIRGFAAALDARDPYTAGHSERVSALSVLMAREMKLAESDVDVIRLGALLHDIGKIGVSDEVLRKPGALTAEEFEQIKRHPALGARILRQVPFLAAHLPIVELHHERPDGKGYPFGLRADDIPLAARIVHVADAFDAMTSARAYRPARPAAVATAELQRCSGNEFDPACVDALCAALPGASSIAEPQLQELLGRGV